MDAGFELARDGPAPIAEASSTAPGAGPDPAATPAPPDLEIFISAGAQLHRRGELIGRLGEKRRIAESAPDAAHLIVRAYKKWGAACPSYLEGSFAFVIRDKKRRLCFCARDHMGLRPFYYSLTTTRFRCADDIQTLLEKPEVSRRLDEPYLATLLSDGFFCHPRRTCYRDIRKLPPGHSLTIRENSVKESRYWHPEDAPDVRLPDDDAYVDRFQEILSRSVRDCVAGHEGVGAHLSGGLDSSVVTVMAARALRCQGRPGPHVLSWEPPPERQTEGAATPVIGFIEAVCSQERLTPHYLSPGHQDVLAFLTDDLTLGASASVLIYEQLVQRKAADLGASVILSGWGGDQGISSSGAGYESWLLRRGHMKRLYATARARSERPIRHMLTAGLVPLLVSDVRRLKQRIRLEKPEKSGALLASELAARVPRIEVPKTKRQASIRQVQLHALTSGWLTDRIESWAVSASRIGLTYGYPLLDRELLEFALGLPPELYRRGRWGRWLMRIATEDLLPDRLRWSEDKSDRVRCQALFDVLPRAFDSIHERLSDPGFRPGRSEYVNMPELLRLLDTSRSGFRPRLGAVRNALRLLEWS